jgi:hypothetical protein
MQNRFCSLSAVAAFVCLPALAQSVITGSSVSASGNTAHGVMHFGMRPFPVKAVIGAPYSAERVMEHVQTLADGTRFATNNRRETIYRDSQGRTRTERPMMMLPNVPDAPSVIEISDPVANVGYTLDTEKKVAHRVVYSASSIGRPATGGGVGVASGGGGGSRQGVLGAVLTLEPGFSTTSVQATTSPVLSAAASDGRPRPETTHEKLGSQLIDSVMADGERTTMTWAVGSQGNDRPFQTTSESWFSPELKEMVLSKFSDPRSGENTTKLININRAEPPASLFGPPPDYTIVDETGPFEIQWSGKPSQ